MRVTFRKILSATSVVAILMGSPMTAEACTSFILKAEDGSPVYGRTMEFGQEMNSSVVMIPRNYGFTSTSGAKNPTTWTGAYAVIGMDALGETTMIVDGMNEKGLAGGLLYFPGYADYPAPTGEASANEIAPGDLLTWILSNFESIDEVKAALAAGKVTVAGFNLPALKQIPPMHLTVHDATGASIVIEPIDGQLVVSDNPLSVMTNSPSFDWHMTNLRNYVNISPVNRDHVKVDKVDQKVIAGFGQGSGLLGLPGDPTPPSRFIRAATFVATVQTGKTSADTLKVTEHVLNNFDIPVGWIMPGAAELNSGDALSDYTQWSSMADLKNGTYYVREHDMVSYQSVGFDDFDNDAKDLQKISLPEAAEPYNKLLK